MNPDFFQVFAKNSLLKNILEEEKSLIVAHDFFFWKILPNWVHFGQGEDFKLTTKLSEKVQYQSRNQAINKSLNEALLHMLINESICFSLNKNSNYCYVHMNVVPRSTGNANSGTEN